MTGAYCERKAVVRAIRLRTNLNQTVDFRASGPERKDERGGKDGKDKFAFSTESASDCVLWVFMVSCLWADRVRS